MATTGQISSIDTTVQKTRQWIGEMREQTGRDEAKCFQMLRAVLTVLRDRLPVDVAVSLSAQLPALLRGYFFEGWRPAEVPVKYKDRQEFIDAVARELKDTQDVDPQQAVDVVMGILHEKVSPGEVDNLRRALPESLRGIIAA